MKLLLLTAAFVAMAAPASAQQLMASAPHYPNVDKPMALGDADTVTILNRIVVDRAPGQRGARLDVHFSTRVPESDEAGRARQADRVAQIVGPDAWTRGARRVTVSICDTKACAETREPPRQWYVYERGPGGVWQRVRGH